MKEYTFSPTIHKNPFEVAPNFSRKTIDSSPNKRSVLDVKVKITRPTKPTKSDKKLPIKTTKKLKKSTPRTNTFSG